MQPKIIPDSVKINLHIQRKEWDIMKKNGYLRRFLALFLALVMIMADSSVTTFAATVGRVKQKSAAAETENQHLSLFL